MSKPRHRSSAPCKLQLALEAAKGLKTITERASAHGVHPTQVSEWKRQLLEVGSTMFRRDGASHPREPQAREVDLYEPIGRLTMD